jgi:O-antigen ligase/tetratricopeptide (TPR) repeat protein
MVDGLVLAGVVVALAALPLVYDRAARDLFTTPKRVVFGVAATGLLALAWSARVREGIESNRAFLCLFAFLAAAAFGAASATSPVLAVEAFRDLALIALPAALLGSSVLRSPRRVLLCANALGVAGLVTAVVGICQHQRLDWWGWRESVEAARAGGPAPSPDLLAWPVAGGLLRGFYSALDWLSRNAPDWLPARLFARLPTVDGAASVFGHPNVAAEMVAAGLAAFAVSARAAWDQGRRLRVLGLVARAAAMATMSFYVVLTGTRGAWVALAVTIAALTASFVIQAPPGRRARRVGIVILTAAALGAVGWLVASRVMVPGRGGGPPEPAFDRVASVFRPPDPARDTIHERRVLWANTHGMVAERRGVEEPPMLLGVGPGNWQVEYPLHHRDDPVLRHPVGTYTLHRYADHAHQDPLELLAEHGLVGTGLFVVFLGVVLARLVARTRSPSRQERHAALALLAVLIAFGTVSLFSFPFRLAPPLMVVFLFFGAALASWGGPEVRASRALAAGISGLLFAGIAALGGARPGADRFGLAALAVAAGVVALASLPLDRRWVARGAGSRALWIASVFACAIASLGAGARLRATEDLQAAWDHAFGARVIPGERRLATERARAAYDRASAGNPADFFGEIARADFLGRVGLVAEAEASARRALLIHPWLIVARVELSALLRAQGDGVGAMREAVLARSLNPDAVEPHLLVAELFLKDGRDQLAAQELERAIDLAPKRVQPKAKVRAAEIYVAAGQELTRALRHLEEAEKEAPDDPEVLGRIAAVYAAPGSPPGLQAKAERLWARVAALDPGDARARLQITVAPLLSKAPPPEEVERILESLDTMIRNDPEFDPGRVRYFRALALERLGRQEEAAQALREVTLLLGVGPFRTRGDDRQLDEAIESMRQIQQSRAESRR